MNRPTEREREGESAVAATAEQLNSAKESKVSHAEQLLSLTRNRALSLSSDQRGRSESVQTTIKDKRRHARGRGRSKHALIDRVKRRDMDTN